VKRPQTLRGNRSKYLGFTTRKNKETIRKLFSKNIYEHKINLYGKKNLERWIKIIGFSNPAYFRVLDKNDIFSTLKRRPRGALR